MATRGLGKGTCNKSIVDVMRSGILIALAALLELTGWVWILQGVGILPGSFMTGQAMWAVIGAILVTVAGVLLVFVLRSRLTRE
jgi:hypothetical protein